MMLLFDNFSLFLCINPYGALVEELHLRWLLFGKKFIFSNHQVCCHFIDN